MNYIKITKFDTANGNGVRVVLWVAGCNHHCKGCQNPETWNLNIGKEFDENAKQEIYEMLSKKFIKGITFSGGDPLHPENRDTILNFAEYISKNFPDKTIWCYTGYMIEELKDCYDKLKYIDVLVDGEYHELERNITLPYCGSENQRVIDVKKSLDTGIIYLYNN